MQYPNGFLWGTATAAHQVEGGNSNCDCWVMEHAKNTFFMEPSGDACDQYHRYREDIELLASLGFNSYRFSIEWARIEPEDGEFSAAQLEHYRRMLAACHERKLVPVITFHHFTSPRWIAARGGWENPETAERFARFCERATRHLGDMIGVACTLNELNSTVLLQDLAILPPDDKIVRLRARVAAAESMGVAAEQFSAFPFCSTSRACTVALEAHQRSVEVLRSGPGKFPVGMTLALHDMQAIPGGEVHRDRVRREAEDIFMEAARGDDFVGVQTYSRVRFGPEGVLRSEPGVEL
ncbi:MAG TPA: family 1 glycosylhydrolase, partial [Candidatus Binataceae bacterium]|nr:family 1 glycosylhydrolase [Candidatus Binataceae bacterium]